MKHLTDNDQFYGFVTLPAKVFFELQLNFRLTLDSYFEPSFTGHAGFSYWLDCRTRLTKLREYEAAPEEYVTICTILCSEASKVKKC